MKSMIRALACFATFLALSIDAKKSSSVHVHSGNPKTGKGNNDQPKAIEVGSNTTTIPLLLPTLVTTSAQLANLSTFFNASISLNTLFTCNSSTCDPEAYQAAVYPYNNVLIVAETAKGKLVGGYRSQPYERPHDQWTQEHLDTKAFIFNIDEGLAFQDLYPNENSTYQYQYLAESHYELECWLNAMCIKYDPGYLSVDMVTNVDPFMLNATGDQWIDAIWGPSQHPYIPASQWWGGLVPTLEAYQVTFL